MTKMINLAWDQILQLKRMSLGGANKVRFADEEETTERQCVTSSLQDQEDNAFLNNEIQIPEDNIGTFCRRHILRLAYDPVVNVLVGRFEHRCSLHRGLLWQHSLFFRNLLGNEEEEASAKNTTLESRLAEEHELAFSVFANWLNFRFNFERGRSVKDDRFDVRLLFYCYILAVKLQAPKFKEYIFGEIKIYCATTMTTITLTQIRYVYENTRQTDDPLRRYCIWKMCVQAPIDETLADPELLEMMREGGGPLVNDILEARESLATNKGEGLHQLMVD
ncbi:hypothetical protein PISL3812_07107 [Talaromyces islandicus]|uniref:BTB domain-containing protein n=1 Tax=Talaromyces islandicus TaxID=28573 RepID=A0A0U1M501_TALIS|nr:hypothetical protein PISL3812_07107 [Talaromyces islandicus]